MAKKKADRMQVKLQSTESVHFTYIEKNRRNDPQRMELRRYDPELRRHVVYRETR